MLKIILLSCVFFVGNAWAESLEQTKVKAERGDSVAQFDTGYAYSFGEGVLQDYKLAPMWWNITATDGDEDASKNHEIVAKQMSSEDVSKAQDMVREWVKNHE